ncbi:MAG: D-alanyl-D-alanine carboxypeptidase [Bacilli bacterium]|nr:D-alanyl-D-alanine carboxypeptidase [Bacilli bacterium]
MKRLLFGLFLIILIIPLSVKGLNEKELVSSNTTSAILLEESTGKILYSKEIHKKVPVASLTKMVAQIIILEDIEQKKIKWDDVVTVSKNASDMGGSQIYLQYQEKMTVRDLFKGISMASANDATVAMAEYIAGSEEKFVKMMNSKVKKLGLKDTNFKNATGLDEENHYSTAYDIAMIARELLTHKDILSFSGLYEDYLRKDTPNKFWLVNTNKLIRFYDKADGLKTGHTDNAKYCIAATAKRDDLRLIAIILGAEKPKIRNQEATNLLDYGFNNTKYQVLYKKNKPIKKVKITNGSKKYLHVLPKYDVIIVYTKAEKKKGINTTIKMKKIKLPIKKNQVVGTLIIKSNKKVINKIPLKAKENIHKLSFIKIIINNLKSLVY